LKGGRKGKDSRAGLAAISLTKVDGGDGDERWGNEVETTRVAD